MNYKNITIGIVTFKSEKVIFNCLKSIKKIKKIIILDNSNDFKLKKKINKLYPNVKFILSKKNLGYGNGNNKIINKAKTDFVFILSPDTMLGDNCEKELLNSMIKLKSKFAIISPISNEKNYGFFKNKKINNNEKYIDVDWVKGFALLFNKSKIKKIGMFDKKIFLYLEEIDLCRRLVNKNEKIYIAKNSKIKHLAAKSSNLGFEYDKCRSWHWMWSKIYYNKKYGNFIKYNSEFFFNLFKNLIKLFLSLIFMNKKKFQLSFLIISGALSAYLGFSSWYRPNIKSN